MDKKGGDKKGGDKKGGKKKVGYRKDGTMKTEEDYKKGGDKKGDDKMASIMADIENKCESICMEESVKQKGGIDSGVMNQCIPGCMDKMGMEMKEKMMKDMAH